MKDAIYKRYVAFRQRKRLAKEARSRSVLAKFFYSVKIKRQWFSSTSALVQRVLPMKLLVLRWIVNFRIRKREAARLVASFLNRRIWRCNLQRLIHSERLAKLAVENCKARIIQTFWRGSHTRVKMYQVVTVVVRKRLQERLHRTMWVRIYRSYRRYSLRTWVDEMFYSVRWGKADEVKRLLFSSHRISSRSVEKVNIRQPSCDYTSLLHMAVQLQHAVIVYLLLLGGADPFAFDNKGKIPANHLFDSAANTRFNELQHAETLSVIVGLCPESLFCPNKNGDVVDEIDLQLEHACVDDIRCGQQSLRSALDDILQRKQREKRKQQHALRLQGNTSIIELIDPDDWHSILPFRSSSAMSTKSFCDDKRGEGVVVVNRTNSPGDAVDPWTKSEVESIIFPEDPQSASPARDEDDIQLVKEEKEDPRIVSSRRCCQYKDILGLFEESYQNRRNQFGEKVPTLDDFESRFGLEESAPRTPPAPQVGAAQSLKHVANAQYRKKVSLRRKIERDPMLKFLLSR